MLVTSKEASKLLQQLDYERSALLTKEIMCKSFLAAVGEDIESCRPEYDYDKMQSDINEVESKIIKLKHSINKFNVETVVDGFNKTIDEMLVYIPQLSRKKSKLETMMNALPKEREQSNMRSTIIDYRYTNYDTTKVKADYDAVVKELSEAQIALDTTNISSKFEVEI